MRGYNWCHKKVLPFYGSKISETEIKLSIKHETTKAVKSRKFEFSFILIRENTDTRRQMLTSMQMHTQNLLVYSSGKKIRWH